MGHLTANMCHSYLKIREMKTNKENSSLTTPTVTNLLTLFPGFAVEVHDTASFPISLPSGSEDVDLMSNIVLRPVICVEK